MLKQLVLLVCLVGVSGCAAIGELFRNPEDTVLISLRPDRLYETLVPRYIELCAISQYRPHGKVLGGAPGHAVMYLKGACRDETAGYPRLRACKGEEYDRSSLEHGAGVSVNRWFKNVNWVATPGKDLFYDGGLARYDVLDQEHFDETVQSVLDLGTYDGVEFHTKPGEAGPKPLRQFVEEESIGTDFALRFGRSVFCTRVPMNEGMLTRAMDYLNALNDEYHSGKAVYEWSGYSDNCVHTLHNSLAAAGIWKPKSVRAVKLRQAFNMAVPANTFIDLAFLGNEYPIEDFEKIRHDELRWKNLVEENWLPAGAGVLLTTRAVHQDNDLYDGMYRMLVLEGWFTRGTSAKARRLMADGRYTSLDANLRHFRDRYSAILAARGSDETDPDHEIYYRKITESLANTQRLLVELAELDGLREEILDDARAEWRQRVGEVETQ
jgi:hypothetical protein